jgi:hypothetical protein
MSLSRRQFMKLSTGTLACVAWCGAGPSGLLQAEPYAAPERNTVETAMDIDREGQLQAWSGPICGGDGVQAGDLLLLHGQFYRVRETINDDGQAVLTCEPEPDY